MSDRDLAAFARYSAGVARAREEHRREPIHFAVDALCETCQTNKRDGSRKCSSCCKRAKGYVRVGGVWKRPEGGGDDAA